MEENKHLWHVITPHLATGEEGPHSSLSLKKCQGPEYPDGEFVCSLNPPGIPPTGIFNAASCHRYIRRLLLQELFGNCRRILPCVKSGDQKE